MAKGAAAHAIETLGARGADAALIVAAAQLMATAIAEQAEELKARHDAERMGEELDASSVDAWHAIDLEALALGSGEHGR